MNDSELIHRVLTRHKLHSTEFDEKIKLEITPILGGLTNRIYKVERIPIDSSFDLAAHPTSASLPPVFLFRILLTHDSDNSIINKLANDYGVSPYILHFWSGKYKIEEFIDGRTLQDSDILDLSDSKKTEDSVSTDISDISSSQSNSTSPNTSVFPFSLTSAHSAFFQITNIYLLLHHSNFSVPSSHADTFDEYYKFVHKHQYVFTSPNSKLLFNASIINQLFSLDLINKFKNLALTNPLTFCHNDGHLYNFLTHHKTRKINIIDFDYSAMNYFFYDLTNFLEETCVQLESYQHYDQLLHLMCKNYTKNYFYFNKRKEMVIQEKGTDILPTDWLSSVKNLTAEEIDEISKDLESGDFTEQEREFYNDLKQKILSCIPFVNYFWILWSLVKFIETNPSLVEHNSDDDHETKETSADQDEGSANNKVMVEFDYLEYAMGRYNRLISVMNLPSLAAKL